MGAWRIPIGIEVTLPSGAPVTTPTVYDGKVFSSGGWRTPISAVVTLVVSRNIGRQPIAGHVDLNRGVRLRTDITTSPTAIRAVRRIFHLADGNWSDSRAGASLKLDGLHDEGKLVDLLCGQLIEL